VTLLLSGPMRVSVTNICMTTNFGVSDAIIGLKLLTVVMIVAAMSTYAMFIDMYRCRPNICLITCGPKRKLAGASLQFLCARLEILQGTREQLESRETQQRLLDSLSYQQLNHTGPQSKSPLKGVPCLRMTLCRSYQPEHERGT